MKQDKVLTWTIYVSLLVAFGGLSYQAIWKWRHTPYSTVVEYRYGDDNSGTFKFPSMSICPIDLKKAFGSTLSQTCPNINLKQPLGFTQVVKACAEDNAGVSDVQKAVTFQIGDILRTLVIGNFIRIFSNMHEVWQPKMHYNLGLCYTFHPSDHPEADLDLNSRTDVLKFASLNFNLSTLGDSGINIYVHDPIEELHDVVLNKKFVIKMMPGDVREVKFSKTVISAISRPKKVCSQTQIGPETCIYRHAEAAFIKSSGCRMPWMSNNATQNEKQKSNVCQSPESLHQLYNAMSCTSRCLFTNPFFKSVNSTQCPREQPCDLWILPYYDIKDPSSSSRELLKLNLDSNYVVMVKDIHSYDFQSLFGEVGGTMGLLMGISFAHILKFFGSLKNQCRKWIQQSSKQ